MASYPFQADRFMEDDSPHADADFTHPAQYDPGNSSGGFELSTKLKARIRKLTRWRIDPSSITVLHDSQEFYGGHATVSKAFRPWEDLALKKTRIADDTDLERALGLAIREAEFLAGLWHPNIVAFKGFVEDVSKSIIWLVFPWAYFGNLQYFVALVDWEIPERISLINDVAQGLAYLHSRDPPICHGDLKSFNVLVDMSCCAAITDFGSARHLPLRTPKTQIQRAASQAQSTQSLNATFCASTNTITLTGNKYTLRWAAPELLSEDQLSLCADIWALGWIAYEVMTNSLPFQDTRSDVTVVERVLEGKLPSLTDNASLSLIKELCSLMSMCWENDPSERPTADECRESIKKMPMFAPSLSRSGRTLTRDRLREVGHLYLSRGEYERAFQFFTRVLGESKSSRDEKMLISSLHDLAELHRLRDGPGDRRSRADTLWSLAHLHRSRGEYDKAIPLYLDVVEIRADLGDRRGRSEALGALADLGALSHEQRHQREYDEAIPKKPVLLLSNSVIRRLWQKR